ncbi:hypothetical protein BLD44_008165 [Mastigocladus laminosus UU774]|nr:hypothetical protein BLD44_008165 [Mastigocladus laminosus UU774]
MTSWICRAEAARGAAKHLAARDSSLRNIIGQLSRCAASTETVKPLKHSAIVRSTEEEHRANILSALAQKLPELLPEALAAARSQDESSRTDALSALAEKLPREVLPEALAAARSIESNYFGTDVLRALALGLSQAPSATLFPLWEHILHELSLGTRPYLLRDIKALFPVIFALGGEAATAEVARAIEDVGRWWR